MPNHTEDVLSVIIRLLQIIPYFALLLVLLMVTWYVLRLLRANLAKTELRPVDYLESFQKLYEEGELTLEEYRLVKRLISLQPPQCLDRSKPNFSPPD